MNINKNDILTIGKSATIKQSTVTIVSVFTNGILGFFFYYLVARSLGPEGNGMFGVIASLVGLVASIANLGIDTAATKFISSAASTKIGERYINIALMSKGASFFTVFSIGLLLSGLISQLVFSDAGYKNYINLAFLGVGGSMFFSLVNSIYQAKQQFLKWGAINIVGNFSRLIVFFVGLQIYGPNILVAVLSLISIPYIFSTWYFVKNRRLIFFKIPTKHFQDFSKFAIWIGATTLISALVSRADILITASMVSKEQLGNYTAAATLAGFVSQIVMALGMVSAPKFSSFDTLKDAKRYFRKLLLLVFVLAVLGVLVGVFLSYTIVPYMYGESYTNISTPLAVLVASYALFLLAMPYHNFTIYFLGKSRFMLWVSVLHALVFIPSLIYLTKNLGIVGASIASLVGMVVVLVVPLAKVHLHFAHETNSK